jgi:opacity protein-like surface antigen
MIGNSVRRKRSPWRTATPRSNRNARIWLTTLVRWPTSRSRGVIGAEGDGEWANLRGTTTFPNTGPPSDLYETHIDDQSSIRGRIGYLLEPRLVLYATGGVAFASIKEHDHSSTIPRREPVGRWAPAWITR